MTRTATLQPWQIERKPGYQKYKGGVAFISDELYSEWEREGFRSGMLVEESDEKPGTWVAIGLK